MHDTCITCSSRPPKNTLFSSLARALFQTPSMHARGPLWPNPIATHQHRPPVSIRGQLKVELAFFPRAPDQWKNCAAMRSWGHEGQSSGSISHQGITRYRIYHLHCPEYAATEDPETHRHGQSAPNFFRKFFQIHSHPHRDEVTPLWR